MTEVLDSVRPAGRTIDVFAVRAVTPGPNASLQATVVALFSSATTLVTTNPTVATGKGLIVSSMMDLRATRSAEFTV